VEILKSNIEKLGLLIYTDFTFNGQEAINKAKNELDLCLFNVGNNKKIKPINLMLLDF
jgi:hypothetical protein